MDKQTCGPLYQKQLTQYAGDDPQLVRIFAAGFVSGQAEKIYLGACSAAMFRPAEEFFGMVNEIAHQTAKTYDLSVEYLDNEIWLVSRPALPIFYALLHASENSPQWHVLRGVLTGVPTKEIDVKFHARKGFGERCDELKAKE